MFSAEFAMLKTFQSSYLMFQVVFLLLFSVDRDINQGMFVFDFDFWAKFACFICSYGKIRSSTGVVCQERMMCLHIYFQNFIRVLLDLTSAKRLPPSM